MRKRLRLQQKKDTGQGAINLDHLCDFNCWIEQLAVQWENIPAGSETAKLTRQHPADTDYNQDYVIFDPFVDPLSPIKNFICVGNPWRFDKGDRLKITVTNNQNALITAAVWIVEVD